MNRPVTKQVVFRYQESIEEDDRRFHTIAEAAEPATAFARWLNTDIYIVSRQDEDGRDLVGIYFSGSQAQVASEGFRLFVSTSPQLGPAYVPITEKTPNDRSSLIDLDLAVLETLSLESKMIACVEAQQAGKGMAVKALDLA